MQNRLFTRLLKSKTFIAIVSLTMTLTSHAFGFEVDDIYYSITSSSAMTVCVTYSGIGVYYEGHVGIPSEVSFNDRTYTVTAIGNSAFAGSSELTGVTIPKTVTSIGNSAFAGCKGISSFSVPAWVETIGNSAFSGCSNLTQVIFQPATFALTLGYGASKGSGYGLFYDCPLTSIVINRNLKYSTGSSYGYSPFAYQDELTKVEIGEDVTSIPSYLFYGSTSPQSFTVPSHVTRLNDYAFCGYMGGKVTIHDGIESIGAYAFSSCENLTSFTIPPKVDVINEGTFKNTDLASLVIPAHVTSIGNYAFNGCKNLKEVTFEDGDKSLSLGYNYYTNNGTGKGLFNDCPLQSVYVGRNLSYSTRSYDGYSPFYNNETLTSIRFGNEITKIPNYICCNCTALNSMDYNEDCTPTSIGSYAFYGCKLLTEKDVKYPTSVTTLEASCFSHCTGLEGYTIPDHVTAVADNVFNSCTSLGNVIVKPSVTSIGNGVFNGCTSLEQFTFEDNDKSLSLGYNYYTNNGTGKGLFNDCPLQSVYIGRNLSYSTRSYDGYSPFYNNETLTTVRFGNEITHIPNYIFYNCTALTTVNYNQSCLPTAIGSYAFRGCKAITEEGINYPSSVTALNEGAFRDCTALTTFTFSPTLTSVGNYAFNGCTSLQELTFEDNDKSLSLGYNYYTNNGTGKGLFNDCPLQSVYIGRNLSYSTRSYDGYSPFYNNETLTSIRFGNEITKIPNYICCNCTALNSMDYNEDCTPTSIGSYAFYGCKLLTEDDIQFPSSVTSLGESCFHSCTGLKEFCIPANVETIGNYVFNGCTNLSELTIEDCDVALNLGYNSYTNNGTGKGLFKDCPLNFVYIGRDLSYSSGKNYGYSPLADIATLNDVSFGKEVPSVPAHCLTLNKNLVEISFDSECRLKSIGTHAFDGCSSLNDVEWPCTLESIGEYAFYSCEQFTTFTVLPKMTSIGNYAFGNCTGITQLIIEDSDEKLSLGYGASKGKGYGLFFDCPLESVYRGRSIGYESSSSYGYSPFACHSTLRKATFGGAVTGLGENLFYNCKSLETVVLPEALTSIKNAAFKGCTSLVELYLPPLVNTIGTTAFNDCSMLMSLYSFNMTPPTFSGSGTALSGIPTECRFYVFTADAHKKANGWKNRANDIVSLGAFTDGFVYTGEEQTIRFTKADSSFPIDLENQQTRVGAGTYNTELQLHYTMYGNIDRYVNLPYTYSVGKVELIVTANNQTRMYGEDNPDLTARYEGFVNGEYVEDLITVPTLQTKAKNTSNAGTYPITVSGGESDNYSFTYKQGTLTIEKAWQEITWDIPDSLEVGVTMTLGATSQSGLSISYNSDNADVIGFKKIQNVWHLICIAPGIAHITLTQDGNENYEAAEPLVVTISVVPTTIDAILPDKPLNDIIYDIQGRQYTDDLYALPAGVYIVNGKKFWKK